MFVCNKRLSQDNFYRHENVSIARGSNIQREDAERSPTYLSISTGQPFHFSCWLAIQKFCPITTAEGGSLNMVIGGYGEGQTPGKRTTDQVQGSYKAETFKNGSICSSCKDSFSERMQSFVCLLSYLTAVQAGSHSLMVFATYITGQTPFPEFTLVLMLDDVQVLYYDSVSLKAIHRSQSNPIDYNGDDSIFSEIHDLMKFRTFFLKDHQNCTDGLHVYQKHVGCELLDNDQPGLFLSLDAFNGQNTEEFTFDVVKRTMQINLPWMRIKGMGQIEWLHVKFLYEHVYHPVCLKTLRTFLEKEKNTVMRKLKPKVRLFRKPLTDSQGLQISCLATGFYPRHINLTLFRDGQPVDDDQITGGEILPNGDGTYQMRKSLVISSEELREGHKYNCTIKHLNLDNKLDIAFDEDLEKADFGSSALSIIISVLVLMCMAVLSISALIIWRKRCAAEISSRASHQSGYSPTSTSEQDTT
ncbi:hypothetical protein Q8A67_010188 [Cirrhinus molitorella]|uniref:Ig-like domain-containing protein n=1 Tax=Cirrhinus molitorella TaxID=172907 RepID=A0AA88TP15_9TELE|nr:hypothetical protein Q8A67_010188 [Cirrhinus molitorella]